MRASLEGLSSSLLRGAQLADLEAILIQLQRLARLALEQKKSLLLWTSL
jgi:hypothetical protein